MSGRTVLLAAGGGVVAVWLLNLLLPLWLAVLVVVGVPVAGYLMLDPSQRRRLRRQVGRREIGR
jgi:Flp pilus assembly protein TadB